MNSSLLRISAIPSKMPSKKKKASANSRITIKSSQNDKLHDLVSSETCYSPLKWLQNCLNSTDPIEQVTLIKQIGQNIHKKEADFQDSVLFCCEVLVEVYLELPLSSIIKRAVASVLQNSPEHLHGSILNFLKDALTERLREVSDITNDALVRHLVDNIIACFDNFPLGEESINAEVISVLQFCGHSLILLHEQLKNNSSPIVVTLLCQNLEAVVRSVVLTLQKCTQAIQDILSSDKKDFIMEILAQLLHHILAFLNDDHILLDCRMHCGMAVPLLLRHLLGQEYFKMILQVAYPKSEVDDSQITTFNVQEQLAGLPSDLAFTLSLLGALPITSQLFLTCGLLSVMDLKDLFAEICPGQSILTEVFLTDLFNISKCKNSAIEINCYKGLLLWTQRTLDILDMCESSAQVRHNLSSNQVISQVMDFLWSHWEHYIEGIRHLARDIFRNFIKIHCLSTGKSAKDSPFVKDLIEQLLTMQPHRSSKYNALSCLVENVGAKFILEYQPSLPQDLLTVMEDKTVSCHASELFEKLFVTHRLETSNISVWQQIWIPPVLTALCQDSKVMELENILTKLLKSCPESLQYITSVASDDDYPTSVKYLCALIKALKTAKILGILNTPRQNSSQYWNNVLPFSVLNHALHHADDEIRLDSFGLLCASSKSTEIVPLNDLELIGAFLKDNSSNQSPAFRQQLLAYVKKLIIRIRDGGYVMRRKKKSQKDDSEELQHAESVLKFYQDFLNYLSDLQFLFLHLGANFPRRGTSLRILTLLHELIGFHSSSEDQFSFQTSLTPFNVQTLFECLRDTYEVNKGLALNILKDLPAELLGFEDEQRLTALFEASLALASSPRPTESVTAAYLFRLMVYFPPVWPVAAVTKQIFEDGCRSAQGGGSGRATPVLELKDSSFRENSTFQEYLIQHIEAEDSYSCHKLTLTILEILLLQLQWEIECAKSNLLEAALNAPMYGLLFSIRSLFQEVDLSSVVEDDQWQNLLNNLIEVCFTLGELVNPVVNNASPEGHLPMDTDPDTLIQLYSMVQRTLGHDIFSNGGNACFKMDTDGDDITLANSFSQSSTKIQSVTAQMLLLCGWRTMKEVSLLLGELCQNTALPSDDNSQTLLSWSQVLKIGEYFTTQLAEIKHRGAFEQAYIGFCKMASSLWNSQGKLHELPTQWLQEFFGQFSNGVVSPKFCKTRRSAGIPFMVQALVSTEPEVNKYNSLNEVINILLNLSLNSQHAETDAHIHALNILRALFRDMKLGETVMLYVARGMKAAIIGFRSKSWAISNSATLLFSALMTRIFGVKRGKDESNRKNCMTGRVFFQRFPSLYEFLLDELITATEIWKDDTEQKKEESTIHLHPSLYPVLLLLSRLYPSALEGSCSSFKLSAFIPYIKLCSFSPNIKNRSLAAQALIPFVPVVSFDIILEELIRDLPSSHNAKFSQNCIHGILLQIKQFLLHLNSTPEKIRQKITENFPTWFSEKIWICTRLNPCLTTRIGFYEVIDTALEMNIINSEHRMVAAIQDELLQEIEISNDYSWLPGGSHYNVIVAKLALNIAILKTEINEHIGIKWSSSELNELSSAVGGSDFATHSFSSHDHLDINWSSLDSHFCDEDVQEHSLCWLVVYLLHNPESEVRCFVMRWLYILLHQETFNDSKYIREEVIMPVSFTSFHWIHNCRKRQHCIQQLLSSKQLISTLISMALGDEQHSECMIELFHVLGLFPLIIHLPWPDPNDSGRVINSYEKLDLVLQRGEVEFRDDLRCALLVFSGSLVPQVYLDISEAPEEDNMQFRTVLEEWADAFLLCCSCEQSQITRTACAHILVNVASYFLLDPHHVLDSASSIMWCALVRLLLDDEPEIKKKAATVINIFDSSPCYADPTRIPHDVQHVVALDLAIGYFVDHYGEKFQTECLTTLLDWCLREEATESFTIHEEDDRLFDKGEMNIYTEEVTLTNVVIKHMKRLLRKLFGGINTGVEHVSSSFSSNFSTDTPSFQNFEYNTKELGDNIIPESLTSDSLAVLSMPVAVKDTIMVNVTIPTEQITPWLSSSITPETKKNNSFILRDIVSMVVEELNILLSEIPKISNKTPFVCRHFERHMLRLYRRIMAVTSLSKYDSSQKESMAAIEKNVLEILTSNAPHFNRLIYVILREIKKATRVLAQT